MQEETNRGSLDLKQGGTNNTEREEGARAGEHVRPRRPSTRSHVAASVQCPWFVPRLTACDFIASAVHTHKQCRMRTLDQRPIPPQACAHSDSASASAAERAAWRIVLVALCFAVLCASSYV